MRVVRILCAVFLFLASAPPACAQQVNFTNAQGTLKEFPITTARIREWLARIQLDRLKPNHADLDNIKYLVQSSNRHAGQLEAESASLAGSPSLYKLLDIAVQLTEFENTIDTLTTALLHCSSCKRQREHQALIWVMAGEVPRAELHHIRFSFQIEASTALLLAQGEIDSCRSEKR